MYISPANIRATIVSILSVGTMIYIIGLAVANNYGVVELTLTILMIPFLFFGFWLSNYARGFVSGPTLRKALLLFCTLSAISLIFKTIDRKSTRLNSSHVAISYAVFCLKKKTKATL